MYGTGFFPTDHPNVYAVEGDGLYLAGTSEVPLAALHMGEMLEELPLRYAGFSTCFRREAARREGHARDVPRPPVQQGRDVRLRPPGDSWDEHERLLDLEEIPAGAGPAVPRRERRGRRPRASAAKKYDIEAWFPFQERYREITSCSNTTDFQARRLGIRYRGEARPRDPHTLNGTMVTDRALLAILENFQGAVPDVLTRYGAPAEVRPGVAVGHNARRRGAGAVERGGLENRWACKRLVGSNPTPAARLGSIAALALRHHDDRSPEEREVPADSCQALELPTGPTYSTSSSAYPDDSVTPFSTCAGPVQPAMNSFRYPCPSRPGSRPSTVATAAARRGSCRRGSTFQSCGSSSRYHGFRTAGRPR